MRFGFLIDDEPYNLEYDLECALINIVSIFPTVFVTGVINS